MKRIYVAIATLSLTFVMVLSMAAMSPARAGDEDLWKGFRFTNCNFSPKTEKNNPQYSFLMDHTSGRTVAMEIDGTLQPAKLTFILESDKSLGESDCAGFQLENCEYIPPNKSFPTEFTCDVKHTSGAQVLLIRYGSPHPPRSDFS